MIWYIIAALIIYFILRNLHKRYYHTIPEDLSNTNRRMPTVKKADSQTSSAPSQQNKRTPAVSALDNPLYYPHCPIQGCHNTSEKQVIVKKPHDKFHCTVCDYSFGKPKIIS
jgi:transposase-like protein